MRNLQYIAILPLIVATLAVATLLNSWDPDDNTFHMVQGPYRYPFQQPSLPWDKRVDDLVSRLTLEEIAEQTVSIYAKHTPAIPRLGIKPYIWITECLRGQRKTNTTAFPQSIGLAASFSESLIYNMSQAVAEEVRAHWNSDRRQGLYLTNNGLSCFSPVINIMRHPLWGRNQETYGEDPYLSGVLAQNYVRGLQGDHPRYVRASAGCKHFDVHGGPENIPVSRFPFDAKVSTRDWRMTFLPQFKKCVEAGTYNLMCSYNSINGVPACANKKLLTDIARKEWGFKGYVVSDAGAILNIITEHKYLPNRTITAAECIKAGCNLELSTTVFLSQLAAYDQGLLTVQEIVDNVKPMFYTRMRLGEFDPDTLNPYNSIDNSVIQSPEHRELAIQAALKSIVLLKYPAVGGLLLQPKLDRLAIVGPFANITDQLFGDYASDILPQYTKTVYQGLFNLSLDTRLGSGCSTPACKDYNPADVQAAALGADVVIVCLGTGQSIEMEGRDRADIQLPGKQLQLLQDAVVAAGNAPVILLLFNAGPLDISWAKKTDEVAVIMACFFPAQATGDALYRLFSYSDTTVLPAGRLPATWPASVSQVPSITNYTMKGFTYRYFEGEPLYPFGYGLSFTSFKYTLLRVQPSTIQPDQEIQATVSVKNTGEMACDEVIQLYMTWENKTVPTPHHQLVGFTRQLIAPGDTLSWDFTITAEQMAVWVDDTTGWGIMTGKMTVYAGGQQPNQKISVGSNVLTSGFTISTDTS